MKTPLKVNYNFTKPPRIDFLKRLTNTTGILQHTRYGVPERSLGYSLDDNARALIVAVHLFKLFKIKEALDYAVIYLSFLTHAKRPDGRFNNFQKFDHTFLPHISEDAFGECIWALGYTIAANVRSDLTLAAHDLFDEVKTTVNTLVSPRAKAYAIIGLYYVLKTNPSDQEARQLLEQLTANLTRLYKICLGEDWQWFENYLTYANHILPAALFYSYEITQNPQTLEIATSSLDFLEKHTHNEKGTPLPIGNKGWYVRGGEKAIFDQQAVDPSYGVLANTAAFRVTKKEAYLAKAQDWFSWFHGNNLLEIPIYDPNMAGVYDGLHEDWINKNQGAESIVVYLLAYLELAETEAKRQQKTKINQTAKSKTSLFKGASTL